MQQKLPLGTLQIWRDSSNQDRRPLVRANVVDRATGRKGKDHCLDSALTRRVLIVGAVRIFRRVGENDVGASHLIPHFYVPEENYHLAVRKQTQGFYTTTQTVTAESPTTGNRQG